MSTSTSAHLRRADLERGIDTLRSIRQNLSVNLDLRRNKEASAYSIYLLDEELQRKQHELAEVQAELKE